MSQTSYDRDFAVAYAGMKADSRFDEVISRSAENAIDFGKGVVMGTNKETQCKLPAATSDKFLGVAVHQHKQPTSAGVARYEDTESVSVLRQGAIWVPVVGAVTAGNDAYLETSTASANVGSFLEGTGATRLLTGAKFMSSYATTSTPALARLEINLP